MRKLICLHKSKIKFAYKEEHRLVLILVFPVAIRQSERLSNLSDLLSVPEFPVKDNEPLPADETLPAMGTLLPKHREKGRNERSLVLVEAYKKLRNYLMRILMPDYKVVSVCDAETAFTTICEQHPDAVLASSVLVEISGEELATRIKSDDRVARVPVILLMKPGEDSKKTQRNADLYVTMSFAISFLKAEIESLITSREIIRKRCVHLMLGVDAPDDIEVDVPSSDGDQELVSSVRSLIEERLTNFRFTIDGLSDCMNTSRSGFYNRIKEVTGHAPADYVRSVHPSKVLTLLMSRKHTVAEIADTMRFNDPRYFRIVFKKCFGDSPARCISNS